MPDLGPVQRIAKVNCLRFQVRDSASPDSAISVIPSHVHLVAVGSDNVGTRAPFPALVCRSRLATPFHSAHSTRNCRWGEPNRWRNPYETLSGKANSYWQQNINVLRRLSVVGSVAPPGTAWGAEGLRGNEANENKLMVLAGVRERKCHCSPVLHKRTSPVVSAMPLRCNVRTAGARSTRRWTLRGPTAAPANTNWRPYRDLYGDCRKSHVRRPTRRFRGPA